MEKLAVERSIWIAGSRERVWRAVTDPEQVAKWFSPGTPWKMSGSGTGSRLYVEGPDGKELYTQVIELFDPPHQVAMRDIGSSNVVTWTLDEENGGTRVTVRETGFEGLSAEERQQRIEQDSMGFSMALENIAAYVEGRSLPYPDGF